MRQIHILFLLYFFIGFGNVIILAQDDEKVWFDGMGRSFFTRDALRDEVNYLDTLSSQSSSTGYNLLDLNTHINPIADFEIFAQLRIRNTFGGFFGSGTSIDVRQLRATGVINKKVRFNIGDIFLNQTRFTLHNYQEGIVSFQSDLFNSYRDIIQYENFYIDNRWRMQGLQTDFSFKFDRYIRSLEFDAFVTRPRGSLGISETLYLSDQIMAGGSIITRISKQLTYSFNYVNLFEIPSSGTTNISIRNPVLHNSLKFEISKDNYTTNHILHGGFSQRHWLNTEDDAFGPYSFSSTEGIFFEFENQFLNNDSTLDFIVGFRHIDPNFRSSGSQTRRLDITKPLTTYPTYFNGLSDRTMSLFDVVSDENIYNQEISSTLMAYNQIYSNVLPYGDATPNRQGVFLKLKYRSFDNLIVSKLNAGYFYEIIGQGTDEKRQFNQIQALLKFNASKKLGLSKKLDFVFNYSIENTSREGDEIESLNLECNHIGFNLNAEVADKFFFQTGVRNLNAVGKEFITERTSYGEIFNFDWKQYDQRDFIFTNGLLYTFNDNVYTNIQYNVWGTEFNDEETPNFNYSRLFFVLSVKL